MLFTMWLATLWNLQILFKLINRLYDSTQPHMERKWFIEIKFTTMNKLVSTVLGVDCSQWKFNAIGWLHAAAESLALITLLLPTLYVSIQSDKELNKKLPVCIVAH